MHNANRLHASTSLQVVELQMIATCLVPFAALHCAVLCHSSWADAPGFASHAGDHAHDKNSAQIQSCSAAPWDSCDLAAHAQDRRRTTEADWDEYIDEEDPGYIREDIRGQDAFVARELDVSDADGSRRAMDLYHQAMDPPRRCDLLLSLKPVHRRMRCSSNPTGHLFCSSDCDGRQE